MDADNSGEIGFSEFVQMMGGYPDKKENHNAEVSVAKDDFSKASNSKVRHSKMKTLFQTIDEVNSHPNVGHRECLCIRMVMGRWM